MVVLTTLLPRACAFAETSDLIAGLGLPVAPVDQESWFGIHEPLEDEALLALLLARVSAFGDVADPLAAYLARHTALVTDAMDHAVRRLGAVPSLDDAQLRFGARGLPEALALSPAGWLIGGDRATLAEIAAERLDEHLAQLRPHIGPG